jgi:hypothetical protein
MALPYDGATRTAASDVDVDIDIDIDHVIRSPMPGASTWLNTCTS